MRNDFFVARARFEIGVDAGNCRLAYFEGVGDNSLGVAFEKHIGDGKTLAEHDLLDRR